MSVASTFSCGGPPALPKTIRREQLEELVQRTKLSANEVKALYARFRRLAPSGQMLPEHFRQTMGVLGLTDDPFLPDRMFRVFDADQDGKLTFGEFATSLAVMLRGSEDEKLKLSFEMTAGKRGASSISFEDFQQLIHACNTMMSSLVAPSRGLTSEEDIRRLFHELSSDEGDYGEVITLDAFKAAAQGSDDFLMCLGLEPSTRGRREGAGRSRGRLGTARFGVGGQPALSPAPATSPSPPPAPAAASTPPPGYVAVSAAQIDDLRERISRVNQLLRTKGVWDTLAPSPVLALETPGTTTEGPRCGNGCGDGCGGAAIGGVFSFEPPTRQREDPPKASTGSPLDDVCRELDRVLAASQLLAPVGATTPVVVVTPAGAAPPPPTGTMVPGIAGGAAAAGGLVATQPVPQPIAPPPEPPPPPFHTSPAAAAASSAAASSSSGIGAGAAAEPPCASEGAQEPAGPVPATPSRDSERGHLRPPPLDVGSVSSGRPRSERAPPTPSEGGERYNPRLRMTRTMTMIAPSTNGRRQRRHRLLGPKKGLAVHFGHESWNMVLSMMVGIRMSVGRCRHEMFRELQPVDFIMQEKFSIIPRLANIFDSEVSKRVTVTRFIDYAPMVFHKIRNSFGIHYEDYLRSVGPEQLLGNMVLGNLSSLSELSSEGKSGAFFYYTADGNYMMKTVTTKEFKLLRGMLKQYYDHIIQNPGTLIVRFLGLHCLRVHEARKVAPGLPNAKTNLYFVVMANMFNAPFEIHRRYDLKGSWVGRFTPEDKAEPGVALKDEDFKQAGDKVFIGEERRQKMLVQLRSDSAFLSRNNIIDYSLLLGVHDREKAGDTDFGGADDAASEAGGRHLAPQQLTPVPEAASCRGRPTSPLSEPTPAHHPPQLLPGQPGGATASPEVPLHRRDQGGMLSEDQKSLYFMGVIDILTPYDTIKRLEHHFKALWNDRKGVSCCPPEMYAERFASFMEKVFV